MSLGWLTESSLIPKDPKPILGVSSASLLNLQAVVYERESRGQLPTAKKRRLVAEKAAKNEGVEARRAKDEQAAADGAPTSERAKEKLKEKARLYEEIKAGRGKAGRESLVDFHRKRVEGGEEPLPAEEGEDEEPLPASLQATLQARSVAIPPPQCLGGSGAQGSTAVPPAASSGGPQVHGAAVPPPACLSGMALPPQYAGMAEQQVQGMAFLPQHAGSVERQLQGVAFPPQLPNLAEPQLLQGVPPPPDEPCLDEQQMLQGEQQLLQGARDIQGEQQLSPGANFAPQIDELQALAVQELAAQHAQAAQAAQTAQAAQAVFDLNSAPVPSAASSAPSSEAAAHSTGMSMAAARPMLPRWERGPTTEEDMAHRDRIHDETEHRRATVGQERRQAREAVKGRLQALREARSAAKAAAGR